MITEVASNIPPGLIFIVGALLIPFIRGNMRSAYMLLLPLLGIWQLTQMDAGTFGTITIFGLETTHVRIDKLSLIFGYIFYVAAALGMIFAWHNKDLVEQASAIVYMGAAIGAIFAGDLITLFVYWELTAVASVFIIWAARTDRAYKAAMRYLIIQILSGVLLAAGAVVRAAENGSVDFGAIGLASPGGVFIILAFGIKCAFPLMHNWVQDAYPEATPTGTVFLSAFTTKLAVYALARGYAGTEELVWIGTVMAVFPIFYAVLENDLRRVLAYTLNNQLGFMVAGIGVGTTLAINGAVAHAFVGILYKALLFMSLGAVIHRVGTAKGSELGGLYKSMPLTTVFCLVGCASISAFPLFCGFITKSMIITAVAKEGYLVSFVLLLFASACVFHYVAIKIPHFAFFGQDSGKLCQEAPINMLLAMGIASFMCIGIGVYPDALFSLLPYPVHYVPYTTSHVVTILQLLAFSALAFAVVQRLGLYPLVQRSTMLDFDFSYRWIGSRAFGWLLSRGAIAWETMRDDMLSMLRNVIKTTIQFHGPDGIMARTAGLGVSAGAVMVLLFVLLVAVMS